MPMEITVFTSSPGSTEAMTDRPMVQRKNAMVSTSKPERRMALLKAKRPHIMANTARKEP